LNILIVGLGSIARKHIVAMKTLNIEAVIYALRSNLNTETDEGVVNIYNLDELEASIDFAIISNPSNLHHIYIEFLAKKRIPLFIEKPPVHSLENIDSLVSLIDEKSLFTYVACNLRFHPCLIFLKEKLASEYHRVNELNVYCGSYLPEWRSGIDFRINYSANATMGGGVHLDLFHELDYTTWLFGFPEKSSSVLRKVSSLDINAVDYAHYALEYEGFTASITLNYYRRMPKRELEIVFKDDTWNVNLIKNEIINDSGEYLLSAPDFNIKDTYVSQLDYFINCFKINEQPMNSFKESVKTLKVCLDA
jgi:predicted dehydrogenase